MLTDFATGGKPEPLCPDGWVFIGEAMIMAMCDIDDQRVHALRKAWPGREFVVRHTYHWLGALSPRGTALRESERAKLDHCQIQDVDSAAGAAMELIARACLSGRVRTAARDKMGGALHDLDPSVWGVDDPWPRFWSCAIDPERPFSSGETHWIFVEEETLSKELDDWRLLVGMERNWTLESMEDDNSESATPTPRNKGGRPLDAELWSNFVAVAVAHSHNKGWPNGTAGAVYTKLADYAALIGVKIPSKPTVTPAINRVGCYLKGETDGDGNPLFDADGKPVE